MIRTENLDMDFWRLVDVKESVRECWEWKGATNALGYGTWRGRGAHRFALEQHEGELPKTIKVGKRTCTAMVLHSCDHPPCCNPKHLRVGAAIHNSRDMGESRRVLDLAHEILRIQRGDFDGIILPSGAAAVRLDFWRGVDSRTIAAVYRLSRGHVRDILERRVWGELAHVAGEPTRKVGGEVWRRIRAEDHDKLSDRAKRAWARRKNPLAHLEAA